MARGEQVWLIPPAAAPDRADGVNDPLRVQLSRAGRLRVTGLAAPEQAGFPEQRRGEPLTAEEREALGRWQRLSTWRKGIAIGGFSLGTFGLGLTLGGLIFGRWRKA